MLTQVTYKNPVDASPQSVVLVDGGLDTKPTGGGFMVVPVSDNIATCSYRSISLF